MRELPSVTRVGLFGPVEHRAFWFLRDYEYFTNTPLKRWRWGWGYHLPTEYQVRGWNS